MAVLCVFLAIACGYDYRYGRIPNGLIAAIAVLGMGRRFWSGGGGSLLTCVVTIVVVIALLYPFFRIGGLGAGDVKLLGVTAGHLPIEKVLIFLFFSLLVTAMISLLKMWKENNFRERMRYLSEYFADVIGNGGWRLYVENGCAHPVAGVCMAGPVLVSILLCWGGVY